MTVKKVLENQQLIINLLVQLVENFSVSHQELSPEKAATLVQIAQELSSRNTKVDGRKTSWTPERREKFGQKISEIAKTKRGGYTSRVLNLVFFGQFDDILTVERASTLLGWASERLLNRLKTDGYVIYRSKVSGQKALLLDADDPELNQKIQTALHSVYAKTSDHEDIIELPRKGRY